MLRADVTLAQIEQFRAKGIPDEQWPALLETLGSKDHGAAVRALLDEQQPFPASKLVELLAHPRLAVRLGALDLLEDAAGETFGVDPWQEEPDAGANAEALARWKTWAQRGALAASRKSATTLNEETFRALATEIMSGNRERAERAMERLDAFGLAAVAHIEAFFKNQPSLEPAPRAALKAAEYRIVLLQTLPKRAVALARDLAFGTPEAQSTALTTLGDGGPSVLPIIADLLASADPLVRETAVDAAFKAGKQHAAALIVERLSGEKAESVLHAMLRGLGEHAKAPAQVEAIARFVEHPAENVAISALEALGTNKAGDVSAALAGRLADARWRVRAAAVEAIGKRGLKALAPQVQQRLDDSDQFVRVTAVEALKNLLDNPEGVFVAQFEKRDDLKAPILDALFDKDSNRPPPQRLWDALRKAPPEVILQCLDILEERGDYQGRRIPFAAPFATHQNRDVAASALRLLASRGRDTGLLLDALKSGDAVKQDAVLDELKLPPGFLAGTTLAAAAAASESSGGKRASNPVLDQLYQFFAGAPRKAKPSADAEETPAPAQRETHAAPAEMRAALERFLREGSPRQRFRAAVLLTGQGEAAAAQFLLGSLDTLSNLDRRSIAGTLSGLADWPAGPVLDLATRLLRDTAADVREQAIQAWLENERPNRLPGLLAELTRPGSLLNPDDIYDYELDRMAQNPAARSAILTWGRAVLDSASAPEPHKVFAIVLLGRSGQVKEAGVERFLDAPSQWLRRAAYRALGLPAAQARLDALLRDDSAPVRAVLPFLASPHDNGWRHWFDDVHSAADHESFDRDRYSYSSSRQFGAWAQKSPAGATAQAQALSPEAAAALEKLARDPSELVRFEAQFALLRLGRPVDPATLASLLAAQPADSNARYRLGNFLERNFARLGKGYGVLLPLVTSISDSEMPKLAKHFGLEKGSAFTSFAALAQLPRSAAPEADGGIAPVPAVNALQAQARSRSEPFRVIFFYTPGCRDCERVRDMLKRHGAEIPGMRLEEHDINGARAAALNDVLSARFQVRNSQYRVTPSVFTQAGALIREEITFSRLGDLVRNASTLAPDAEWLRAGSDETVAAAAEQTIPSRRDALSPGVIAAGLVGGIHLCAFAMIVFLILYRQVARRTPGEILAGGAAFIAAVFLTYFAIGSGFAQAQALAQIAALRVAGAVLTYGLAGFAVVIAMLSLRDAQLAARGEFGEMTLQLPGALGEEIRSAIRTGARASHFVFSAFAAGIAISLLELACARQATLPTARFGLRAARGSAIGNLLLYDLAFITPLIVGFALAWTGLRSEAFVRFRKQNAALVKILIGVLFLSLAAFLLFGHSFVPQHLLAK